MKSMILTLAIFSGSIALAGGPCKEDVKKFCSDIKPGGGAIVKCLKKHKDDLSEGCKAHHEKMKEHRSEMKEQRKEVREACKADMEKLCGGEKKAHKGKMKCLKEKMSEVSAGCKAEIEAIKSIKHEKKEK